MSDSRKCKTCGHEGEQETILTPESVHYAKICCTSCGAFIAWLGKPDSEKRKRPSAHRKLAKKFSRGYCELCLIREEDLPPNEALEGHHVDEYQDGGEPTRENTWVLCTACHSLVNWRRTYMGHIIETLAGATTREVRR